jgi:hypothetical protein
MPRRAPQRLTFYVSTILKWADAYCARHNHWPTIRSGVVAEVPGESWRKVDSALRLGLRGLLGGSSLARLLAEHRGVRNLMGLPRLTAKQVLTWASAHRRRTGAWPSENSGPVLDAPGETWHALDRALRAGVRGFRGGSSLARLLARRRGVRNMQQLASLTVEQILEWADRHQSLTGRWPTTEAGPVRDATGESWNAIDSALKLGRRGLPGRSSLPRLLAERRGVRNRKRLPRLTRAGIAAWVEAYFRVTGRWPSRESGPIPGTAGETWGTVDSALRAGSRGLKRRTTLGSLLQRYRRRGRMAPGSGPRRPS